MMEILVNRDRCVGAGQCVLSAPDVFDQDDSDGLVVVLNTHPHTHDEVAAAKEAVNVCPGRALTLAE